MAFLSVIVAILVIFRLFLKRPVKLEAVIRGHAALLTPECVVCDVVSFGKLRTATRAVVLAFHSPYLTDEVQGEHPADNGDND